jgi:hypothetical protein
VPIRVRKGARAIVPLGQAARCEEYFERYCVGYLSAQCLTTGTRKHIYGRIPNMPIANCFCKKRKLSIKKMENMVNEWANIVGVDKKDICINMIKEYSQLGQKYPVLVNLYLPTLWSANDIKGIQLGLLKVLSKYLEVKENEIFIMTSLIQSEHVVENGHILKC